MLKYFIALALLAFTVACNQYTNPETTASAQSPARPEPKTQVRDAATAEAQAAAKRFWSLYLTQCGDSYYEYHQDWFSEENQTRPRVHFTQYKHVSFAAVKPRPVTEADRENGYSWRGLAVMNYKLFRTYDSDNGGWGSWIDGSAYEWKMARFKGHWQFGLNVGFTEDITTIDTDSVPPRIYPSSVHQWRRLETRSCGGIPGASEYSEKHAEGREK